jgi:two-component system, LytTR family, response regulator
MIKCVVIDDEQENISVLTKLLSLYCPDVSVAGQAVTATDAIQVIREVDPQLVFLDVEMPPVNAFDLLNNLKPVNFEIIFVTAFDHYALKAFKYSALDYLLKPVDLDDLKGAVQKAVTRIREKNINQRLDNFLSSYPAGNGFSKIALPTLNGLVLYPVEEIICCTAKNTYTLFDFVNDKEILVACSLKEIEEKLPPAIFCRIHHSFLINLNHMKKYNRGKGGYVEMVNGKILEVSLRKREELLSRLR